MFTYCTYYQMLQYGGQSNLPQTIGDPVDSLDTAIKKQFLKIAQNATEVIDRGLGFSFAPYKETKYFDALKYSNGRLVTPGYIWNGGRTLSLYANPLMQLDSATLADSTALVINTDVRVSPRNTTPIEKLQLLEASGKTWTQYSTEYQDAIEIAGIWGYRTRFATEGFIDSSDTVKNTTQIDSTQTDLKVANADAVNSYGWSPRFDVGQILRIENEYLIVTGINYTSNTLTVLRGQLGTTAAAHLEDVQIDTFEVEPPIVEAASLIASYEIERFGQYSNVTREAGFAVSEFPPTWPVRALEILNRYVAEFIQSV